MAYVWQAKPRPKTVGKHGGVSFTLIHLRMIHLHDILLYILYGTFFSSNSYMSSGRHVDQKSHPVVVSSTTASRQNYLVKIKLY